MILSALFALITLNGAWAEQTLEQRVTALENNALSIPSGLFLNGEFEMRYDSETYDSNIDSRAEFILGLENDIDNDIINWGGASARFDSHYALDTTKNNTIVEKQMGVGTGLGRIYFGETDAQRLGFAKTSKVSVPLIITETNNRIDHNEKVVFTFGGWNNNDEFDFDTYLPAEGLTLKTNVNFANQHGGSSQYIEPVFKDYYDKLVYTKKELSSGELIKKHLQPGPGDVASNFITRYSIYLSRVKTLFQHTQMFEHVSKALRELESFVSGFSVPPAIQESINSGQIELNEDLENPSLLKKQIETNKGLYLASNQGLGKRWDWSLSPDEINTKAMQEGWIYIHVIGLKRECWETPDSIFLQPEYINGESIVSLEEAKIEVSLYPNPSEVDFDARSDMLLRWLHITSGLDISELTFSKNPDMIYSEDLIASDSGIFPWSKPDFEDGKPLKRLETIYNMSPWLFPDNMFNDVCVPNEYHRVVACVITKAHLENANIGLETVNGQIDDIIGSIRWKKV